MTLQRRFFRILLVQILFQGSLELTFRPRYFTFEQAGPCQDASNNVSKIEKFVISRPNKFHYSLDADITFFKTITAPIQFNIQALRCSLETNTKCFNIDGLKFDNVCDGFSAESAIWTPLVKAFDPKLRCPIQMGVYKVRNGTADFSALSRLPLEGFRYLANLRFFELTKVEQLEILCFDFELTVSLIANTRRSRKN